MQIKKGKSVKDEDLLTAGVALIIASGLILVNVLIVVLIPNDIIRFSIVGIEILGLLVVGLILLKATEELIDKTR
jgi:hypothetical protein